MKERVALIGRGLLFEDALTALSRSPAWRRDLPLRVLTADEPVLASFQLDEGGESSLLPRTSSNHEWLTSSLERQHITCLISIQYPWILPAHPSVDATAGRAFNLHNAKLPDYRGHHALSHEILNGETEHTVTLHWMQPEVDTGFTCLSATIPIRSDDTAWSLGQRARVEASSIIAPVFFLAGRRWPPCANSIADGRSFLFAQTARSPEADRAAFQLRRSRQKGTRAVPSSLRTGLHRAPRAPLPRDAGLDFGNVGPKVRTEWTRPAMFEASGGTQANRVAPPLSTGGGSSEFLSPRPAFQLSRSERSLDSFDSCVLSCPLVQQAPRRSLAPASR